MNLVELAENNYKKFGEYRSLIFEDKEYTNVEMLIYSRKIANGLKKLGIGPGNNVVVMVHNCPEVLISYQGILRTGSIIVPVISMLNEKELAHILKNSKAVAIITSRDFMPKVEFVREEIETLRYVIIVEDDHVPGTLNFWDLLNESSDEPISINIKDDDLAVIIYTAGTTGTPKGVMLTHQNLYTAAVNGASARDVKRTNITLGVLPLSHSFGITIMNTSFIFGNLFVLIPRFDIDETFRMIEKHKVTNFPGVPAMFGFMLSVPPEKRKKYDLSSLKNVTSGSAPLPVETLEAFEREFDCTITEGYGLTEASAVVSIGYFDRVIKAGSVGQPIPEIEVRIVDENDKDVPTCEVGELIVAGPNISPGYYNMPEETANTFKNGWLYTGDIARLDENGYIYIVERKKDLIIRGGFNIYPRDIEEVLHRHPAVQEAAVIGMPDPIMGEEVKAYIVLSTNKTASEQEIIDFCRQHLSKDKCPKFVEFLNSLPKSTIGKVLRKELRKLAS
jgi:long-chain acyl-CoA synthetase